MESTLKIGLSILPTIVSVVQIIHILGPPVRQQISYLTNIDKNVSNLTRAMEKVRGKRKGIERVDLAPLTKRRKLTHQIGNWITRVTCTEKEVDSITIEFHQWRSITQRHFTYYWSLYELGKRVVKKLEHVKVVEKQGRKVIKKLKDVEDVKKEEVAFDLVSVTFTSPREVEVPQMSSTPGQSTCGESIGNAMDADINVITTFKEMEEGELSCGKAGEYGDCEKGS